MKPTHPRLFVKIQLILIPNSLPVVISQKVHAHVENLIGDLHQ